MTLRYASLLCLLTASAAAAQPVPDTLRAPAEADSITVFGWTVDADADRVLVGARVWPPPFPRASASPERADHHGTVFVYRRTAAGAWEVEGRLNADYISNEDCFSWAMDLRGDLAAVGAECEWSENPDGTLQGGAVYLFRYDGEAWVREAKIYPSDVPAPWSPLFYFGGSVALGEGYLVVGASGVGNPSNPEEDSRSGAVYVFEPEGGAWIHSVTLVNEDTDEQVNEWFGSAVGTVGDTLIVGALSDDGDTLPNRGAVYIFERSGETWSQQSKLTAPTPEASERFGALVATGGGTAAIGSTLGAYPVEREEGGWSLHPRLTAYTWHGVARYGGHILTPDFLFTETENGWEETPLDTPVATATRDEQVSLTAQRAFVGVPEYYSGQVLVYDLEQFIGGEPEVAAPAPVTLSVAPNPVPNEATVHFELAETGIAHLTVYDVLGREVARLAEGVFPAGPHTVGFPARDLAAGTYLVRLATDGQAVTRLVTVLR